MRSVRVLVVLVVAGGCGGAAPGVGGGQSRLASNCEAPLGVAAEVARMLTMAAAHATYSAACVDGPGVRFVVDEVLVCPGEQGNPRSRQVDVRFRVGEFREGDTRGCSGDCGMKPRFATYEATLSFRRAGEDGPFQIVVPGVLPGLALRTPLHLAHDGDCYGKIGPFVPADVSW